MNADVPMIRLVQYSREVVEEALARGDPFRFEDTVPTTCDEYLKLAEALGVLDSLDQVEDPRKTGCIPLQVLCAVTLCRFLYGIESFRRSGQFLLRNHSLLARLGVMPEVVDKGGYYDCPRNEGDTYRGKKLFDEEAVLDVLNRLGVEELNKVLVAFVRQLRKRRPAWFRRGLFIMDSNHFTLKGSREQHKWCALMLWTPYGMIPVAIEFSRTEGEGTGETSVGRRVLARAFAAYGERMLKMVLMDTGYEDGPLLHWLKYEHQVDWLMDPSSDTKVFTGMIAQMDEAPKRPWVRVKPPQLDLPLEQLPERHVMWMGERYNFFTYGGPVNGCVVRDTYPPSEKHPQGYKKHQCIITSRLDWKGAYIHDTWRMRWCIENTFGAMTNFWGLGKWQIGRLGVYRGAIQLMALAYGLLTTYLLEKQQKVPLRGIADRLQWEAENRVLVVCGGAAVVASTPLLNSWLQKGLLRGPTS